jgi:anhydro-N-acetylmuramic acid kinase
MTGTSMDGIDISLVKTNGIDLVRLNENYFYKYSNETKDFLLSILNKDITYNLKRKKFLDKIITIEHYKALKNLQILKNCDLIGFHGQTIYHNPKEKISVQLGDANKLAQMLGKNVVFDFRTNDIKHGGEGAPIAPIFHKFIIKSLKLNLPTCIINIGGVANLTYWDNEKLIGFDTGPGNGLMDNFIKTISNYYFDKNGYIASKGTPNKKIVKKFMDHNFFKKTPPKSLDKNSFFNLYTSLIKKNLSISDTMATLADFTVESIAHSLSFLPLQVKNILITGGGYNNKYLMGRLKKKLNVNFINESDIGIEFDYLEAELIAYLSARSVYNLPITFPSTTGVSKILSGGKIYRKL